MTKLIPRSRKKKISTNKTIEKHLFPIVAIGASSGGLEAITELLKYLSPDTGMAFIVIQHLSADYKSILTSLLAKTTKMKVREIVGMEKMKPNTIYVIPNNKGIKVVKGHIQVTPRQKTKTQNLSIDLLFTSLAETHKENAIGVILSGNASDGTEGLRSIKEEGGITFAQDNSAKFSGMPESAFSEGVADFVMSPKEIAGELNNISKRGKKKKALKAGNENEINNNNADLKIILQLLLKEKGVDFNYYKMPTVKRRILRRMFLNKLETFKQYIKLLKTNSNELAVLYNDLLINITSFFRDEEVFRYLGTTLFPKLIKRKAPDEMLRIWITACSTGQEAYSIAMILIELLGSKLANAKVQIFASDLSEPAIKKARAGEYSKHEVSSVSSKRIERFFIKEGEKYRIDKSVRELCSFAIHNILTDPPFARMDFISCRNMLIYLDTNAYKKVLTTFHYALKDEGYLMLGKSETIGSFPLFSELSRKFKIFSRKKGIRTLPALITRDPYPLIAQHEVSPLKSKAILTPETTEKTVSSILFAKFTPAYVVINHQMEILQFKGATSNYLKHASGNASLNLLRMALPEIIFELRTGIQKAIETKREVRKSDIEIKSDSKTHNVTLDIIPIENKGEEPLLLIIFTEQPQYEWGKNISTKGIKTKNLIPAKEITDVKKLKDELEILRTELNKVNEEKEKVILELNAANQEILSSNEEFQTMSEELETSKEEIESANEELITTNQEIQTRNDQLLESNNFSEAIIATLHEPMLILDKDFTIKSANKSFYETFHVNSKETDGKLLFDLGNKQWNIKELRMMLNDIVQKNMDFNDFEVSHNFPGIGHKIMLLNGQRIIQKAHQQQLILLAIEDITERAKAYEKEKELLKKHIQNHKIDKEELEKAVKHRTIQLQQKNTELESLFLNASMGIIVVNSKGEIVKSNPRADKKFGYDKDELLGKKIETLIPPYFRKKHEVYRKKYSENPQMRKMGSQMDLFGLRKDGSKFPVEVSLSPYATSKGHFAIAFIVDITARKTAEEIINEKTKALERSYETLKTKNASLKKLNKELETFTFISSHDLQEPLRKIQSFVSVLLKNEKKQLSPEGKDYLEGAYKAANRMQMLIEDLLTYSRIKNAERKFKKVDLTKIAREAIANFKENIAEKNAILKTHGLCTLNIVPFQFRQLFQNFISNSLKFSDPKRRLHITIKSKIETGRKLNNENLLPQKKYCHIIFMDNGIGFDPEYKERIFEVFQRLNPTEKYNGSGIGLAICKRIIENHDGFITATGKPNKGARFDIYIPVE
jgi:two-component system CheB/CheR fusion protein